MADFHPTGSEFPKKSLAKSPRRPLHCYASVQLKRGGCFRSKKTPANTTVQVVGE